MNTFACVYYGNTGSSWLLHTLQAAPDVWVPGFEPLERHHWRASDDTKLAWLRAAFAMPPEDPDDRKLWLELLQTSPQVVDPAPSTYAHVGFKVTLDALHRPSRFIEAFRDCGTRVIVLSRLNRLKHALSLYRHHEEDKSQFQFAGELPATEIDWPRFDKWLDRSHKAHAESTLFRQDCISALGSDRVLSLVYEDFVDNVGKDRTIERVGRFLDIPTDGLERSRYYKKATPNELHRSVVNYREMVERFKDGPRAADLD